MKNASFVENFRYYHPYYEYAVGVVAFIVNVLLLYLAVYKSSSHMKKYSVIIIQSCLVDIVFNFMNVIFVPVVDMKDGNLFYFLGGPLENISNKAVCICWMIYLAGMYGTVTNVASQFVYRYSLLCR